MTRKAKPTRRDSGFQQDARAFRRIAEAIGAEDPTKGSGATGPLDASEQAAIDLWNALRAAKTVHAEMSRSYEAAQAAIPVHLRTGNRYVGQNLTEEMAAEVSPWPAILDVDPPLYSGANVRPGPDDLATRYRTSLGLSHMRPHETSAERQRRVFDNFAADVAALAERVKQKREAEQAVGFDEISHRLEEAGLALSDAEGEVLQLPCEGAHATAVVAMARWEGEARGESTFDDPNLSFFRAVLTSLLPSLTGNLAADVAEALAREEDDASDETSD